MKISQGRRKLDDCPSNFELVDQMAGTMPGWAELTKGHHSREAANLVVGGKLRLELFRLIRP